MLWLHYSNFCIFQFCDFNKERIALIQKQTWFHLNFILNRICLPIFKSFFYFYQVTDLHKWLCLFSLLSTHPLFNFKVLYTSRAVWPTHTPWVLLTFTAISANRISIETINILLIWYALIIALLAACHQKIVHRIVGGAENTRKETHGHYRFWEMHLILLKILFMNLWLKIFFIIRISRVV